MKKIYYEKRGRRYVPVAEYDNDYLDSFPKGTHLVMCYPGGQSRRFNIDPNYAAMIAAGRVAEDAIAESIFRAQSIRAEPIKLSRKQRELVDELTTSMQKQDARWLRPASRDAAEAAVRAMMTEADKLLKNPAIRKAFDNFMLLCNLVKEEEIKR